MHEGSIPDSCLPGLLFSSYEMSCSGTLYEQVIYTETNESACLEGPETTKFYPPYIDSVQGLDLPHFTHDALQSVSVLTFAFKIVSTFVNYVHLWLFFFFLISDSEERDMNVFQLPHS